MTGELWPGGDAEESPQLRLPQEDWALPRAHPRYASVLRRLGEDGRFELLGLVEEGGQALLWAARDHGDGERLVVVKAPDPTGKDATVGPRLGREARLLALLDGSTNVMPLLTAGPGRQYDGSHGEFESELPWLALPYRPHVLLPAAVAAAGGALSPDRAWVLGRDLAAALAHLHARGVVHRDLSPGNVLLTPRGVLVADLGMAWAGPLESDDVEARFTTGVTTRNGRGVTWGWLAPEAAQWSSSGERPDRHPAADVFCWGLHVFVALLGRHPWSASALTPDDREQDWMYDGRPPTLDGLDDVAIPGRFRDLVRAALAADPADRPDAATLHAGLGDVRPAEALAAARLEALAADVAGIPALRREAVEARHQVRLLQSRLAEAQAAGPAAAAPAAAGHAVPVPAGPPGSRPRRALRAAGRVVSAPVAVLLAVALVAGAVLALGALRDRAAADRVERAAGALLAGTEALAATWDEYGTALAGAAPQQVARTRSRTDAALLRFDDALRVSGHEPDLDPASGGHNERGVYDRLVEHGGAAAVAGDAGAQQLEMAYHGRLRALEDLVAGIAGDLGPRPGEPVVTTAGPSAAALVRAGGALVRHRDDALDHSIVANGAGLAELAASWAGYEAALETATRSARTPEQRRLLAAVDNDDETLRRWRDDLTRPPAVPQPVTAADLWAWRRDFMPAAERHLAVVTGAAGRLATGAEADAREAERDTVRTLATIAALAFGAGLLVAAGRFGPRLAAARRRRSAAAPSGGEPGGAGPVTDVDVRRDEVALR